MCVARSKLLGDMVLSYVGVKIPSESSQNSRWQQTRDGPWLYDLFVAETTLIGEKLLSAFKRIPVFDKRGIVRKVILTILSKIKWRASQIQLLWMCATILFVWFCRSCFRITTVCVHRTFPPHCHHEIHGFDALFCYSSSRANCTPASELFFW